MRILFVGMAESIHFARWVNQLDGSGWERFVFPIYSEKPHAELRNLTFINSGEIPGFQKKHSLRYLHGKLPFFVMNEVNKILQKRMGLGKPSAEPPSLLVRALHASIRQIKPDIIHSLEFQGAGYLTLEAKRVFKGRLPTWIATNWGSDIYLFGRLAAHRDRVRAVLENCDFYSCECERDVILAREYGLRGEALPVFPNAGGFDLPLCASLKQPGPPSGRKLILLKGYQSWAGRAQTGLRALARCVDVLKARGYSIGVFSATPDVQIAAELFAVETGVPVEIIPPCSHTAMLKKFGQARIYLGLSISDAISTSLLEAIVMGTFPVQSCTACADEWIADGQSGLIVPPEDVDVIENVLRRALTDDALVDKAAPLNEKTARARLSAEFIRSKVIDFYRHVYNSQLENQP